MIEIKKNKEPNKLLKYRKSTGANYISMDLDVKEAVKESLLNEQGYLCAYCMRRIPESTAESGMKIEHWDPRNQEDGSGNKRELDYKNMLGVCLGNQGCGNKHMLTCDSSKGNTPMYLNPCDAKTLESIYYSNNGEIKSDNEVVKHELNVVLNLNCDDVSFKDNRKKVLLEVKKKINDYSEGNNDAYCMKVLEELKHEQGKQTPFKGIAIWWLEKRLKREL